MVLPRRSVICSVAVALASAVKMRSPQSIASETLRALDTNGSGKIEQEEIVAFAKSQGLADSTQILQEFQGLDKDHSGDLDASELEGMLGLTESAPEAPSPMVTAPAPVTLASVPAAPATPVSLAASLPSVDLNSYMVPTQQATPSIPAPPSASAAFSESMVADLSSPASLPAAPQPAASMQPVPVTDVAAPISLAAEIPPTSMAMPDVRRLTPATPEFSLSESSASAIAEAKQSVSFLRDTSREQVSQPNRPSNQRAAIDQNTTHWLESSLTGTENMAVRGTAKLFAAQAQKLLLKRNKDVEQANKLTELAASLRKQESTLMQTAAASTREAAKEAVDNELKESLTRIQQIEADVKQTEEDAVAHHKEAGQARERAMIAQQSLSSSMNKIHGSVQMVN